MTNLKKVGLRFDEDAWDAFKLKCDSNNVTAASELRRLIKEYVTSPLDVQRVAPRLNGLTRLTRLDSKSIPLF